MSNVPFYAEIGSVSHGTMRTEDLIPVFVEALDDLKESESLSDSPNKERYARLDRMLGEIEQRMEREDYHCSEDAEHDLESLFEALNEYAPPFCYFGAHEGDGADYVSGCRTTQSATLSMMARSSRLTNGRRTYRLIML
jgi:hypothetical protein